MGEIGHIFATLAKAIGRILLTGIICGVIGFAAIAGFAYYRHNALTTLDYIVAAVVGVLALYAGGVTVLMVEAVKAAIAGAREVGKEAGVAAKDAGGLVGEIEKEIGMRL
jgi:hypothetical protein